MACSVRRISEQIARTCAFAANTVGRVIKRAGLHREATAADAAIQLVTQGFHLSDALIQIKAKPFRNPRPIGLGRRAPLGQATQDLSDLRNREPKVLGNHHKRQTSNVRAIKPALSRIRAKGMHQPFVLVVANSRCRETRALAYLTNCKSTVFHLAVNTQKNPYCLKVYLKNKSYFNDDSNAKDI